MAGHATAHSFKRFEKQYGHLCVACLHFTYVRTWVFMITCIDTGVGHSPIIADAHQPHHFEMRLTYVGLSVPKL